MVYLDLSKMRCLEKQHKTKKRKNVSLDTFGLKENGTVYVQMSKEEFQAGQGSAFIEEHFNGSLPLFLAAFSRKNKLSKNDVEKLQQLIDSYRESDGEEAGE